MNEPVLFLLLLLAIGVIAKNQSLIIAIAVLLAIKLFGLEARLLPAIQAKGINWGVTVITVAVLAPIATGEIGFKQLIGSLQSASAWIALLSGIFVALIAKGGVTLLASDPHITASLVLGTVIAVSLFHGVAVGPLIGAGIAYVVIKMVEYF
ncbi:MULTISPECIES: DUF441 domain-containing protein [Geobacillus]|mgnify:CR=1 FL=1|jgi:uncharacterized membrane protein (DUF441 family)|uniref:UPF0756 membrane protein HSX42_15340 n=1 Tax=Geobacillus thermodenitrificans TaxID=33940 RepID=A0ABY9QAR6_GEOTD|nr:MULTISPECIES: DUF441 domain-containing protein [Geobacillus]ARA98833.1 hypothetical protein GD3902_12850 [Geobacillus thermodenitrificans]ARP43753.1 hypothetical protein GTHT12_02231 [Geobacillus thermodenitrificans]ATO38200.1 hypothetical protein GTID1_14065 [Geobacillus thermodenitrificans]KQB92301.1 UPF0756 membrane protein [Geobacillus sp. PA-3]MEC5187110.1 uncharacterized membrane protein (DUF441 family) [Geobacillus thermodenitrificans]